MYIIGRTVMPDVNWLNDNKTYGGIEMKVIVKLPRI